MLPLKFAAKKEGLKVLFLGAHCDDIEIGCGGAALRLAEEYVIREAKWVVFSSTPEREKEAMQSADSFLHNVASKEIAIHKFKDGFLFQQAAEIKRMFEELKNAFHPDIIFTHYREDLHQDHRLLSELTWNTYRDHFILEYEIPKYDGDLANPDFFITLDKSWVETKIRFIIKHYSSQSERQWFDKELFQSMMRIRGMGAASKTKYAEAFYTRKMIL
ncbi:PIG-L family deacetylase [soil metagenome]